jgi:hypothetical protein
MTGFGPSVPLFDDENEEVLVSEFVRLSSKYGATYTAQDIAKQVFKDLREPNRYLQVATIWANDLDIKERISDYSNGVDKTLDSQESYIKQLETMAANTMNPIKERIEALKLAAQIQGMIKKQVETNNINKNENTGIPQFVFAIHPDA